LENSQIQGLFIEESLEFSDLGVSAAPVKGEDLPEERTFEGCLQKPLIAPD